MRDMCDTMCTCVTSGVTCVKPKYYFTGFKTQTLISQYYSIWQINLAVVLKFLIARFIIIAQTQPCIISESFVGQSRIKTLFKFLKSIPCQVTVI